MHDRRHTEPLRWGPFTLDVRGRELFRSGERIRLQDKPFELLVALAERPGEVLSREELRSRLWPADTFVAFDDGLNTAVSKLREALGDSAEGPRFIETVPRRGYRFIGSLEPEVPAALLAPPERFRRRLSRSHVPAAAALAALAAAATAAWFVRASRADDPILVRFEIRAPAGAMFAGSSPYGLLSPDGRQIAFLVVPANDRESVICVQALDGSARRLIAGSERAVDFAWSKDGRSIAFRHPLGDLLRHDIAQGTNVRIASGLRTSMGFSLDDDGGILFARGLGYGLATIAPNGAIADVTTLDAAREETMHAWPQMLEDGRSFVYLAISRVPGKSGIYLSRLGETSRTLLVASDFKAIVAEPDMLVYLKGRRLFAQRFDPTRGLLAESTQVAEGIGVSLPTGAAAFSLSRNGTLAFSGPQRPMSRETIWVTRTGQWIERLGPPEHDMSFSLSPDDRWIVFERQTANVVNPELWLHDVQRSITRKVTDQPGNDEGGVWSPDSSQFVYARHRGLGQPSDLYVKDVIRPEGERPLLADDTGSKHPFDWSADGRFILYSVSSPGALEDIWVLPVAEDAPPYPWLATRFRERGARFSPDGRWVVYESDESGQNEIYVRAFVDPRARWQISTAGGVSPLWRRDGRELYFIAADHTLMGVEIDGREGIEAGAPQALFELRRLSPNPRFRTPYAVSADGHRFLIGAVTDEGGDQPLTVLLNWRRLVAPAGQ